jgi:hypothetical protein
LPALACGHFLVLLVGKPYAELEQSELLSTVQSAITEVLTPHRRVLVALSLNGVPIDVLADRLNATRGALYKTLHDARRKLRSHLKRAWLRARHLVGGRMMERPDLKQALGGLLGPAGPEIGCDACFDELDRYVELELAGKDADAAIPGFRAHLDGCPACREEHDSLRALVGGEQAL